MSEPIDAAVRRLFAYVERDGFEHQALHIYDDANAEPLYYRVRMRHQETGKKFIRPVSINGLGYAIKEPEFPSKKPLYGLSLLHQRPDEPVWFVEGEACADALRKLGLVAVTAGSATSHEKADLEPLRGRSIVTWPDNDREGRDHMHLIAMKLILECGCENIRAIDSASLGLKEGGDCIDWLLLNPSATGLDIEQLVAGNPAKLLNDVHKFINQFVAFRFPYYADTVTLWAAHTHMIEHFATTPRLAVLSPEPESGKSRLLEILDLLSSNSSMSISPSVAVTFRRLQAKPVTLLIDEVDTIFTVRGKNDQNEDLRALLNAGYRRGATIPRCVGPNHDVQDFTVFAAAALAGLGDLPNTIMSRSIVIQMRRRSVTEHLEHFRWREHAETGHELRDKLETWAVAVGAKAGAAWPPLPKGVVDRRAEAWEPLIAVADQAGGDWPVRARAAAVADVAASTDRTVTLGVRLLGDLRHMFGDKDSMSTDEIIKSLCAIEEAPWSDLRGKAIDSRGLAMRLKPYGIHSKVLRLGQHTARGYERSALHDAWNRYLSVLYPANCVTSVTSETAVVDSVTDVMQVTQIHTCKTEPDVADVAASYAGDPTTKKGEGMTKSDHWLLQLTGSKSQEIYYGELVELSQVMQDHPEAIAG